MASAEATAAKTASHVASAETPAMAAAKTATMTTAATAVAATAATTASVTESSGKAGQAQERYGSEYGPQQSQTGFHHAPLSPFRTRAHIPIVLKPHAGDQSLSNL
jgi:hypothetical protein